MPDPTFARLAASLREQRVPRAYARRLLGELEDHVDDLERERRSAGQAPQAAAITARESLGADELILSQVLARRELTRPRGWFGLTLEPAAAYADTGAAIARWSVSISLGAALTGAMLFVLASTITSGG